MKKIIYLIVLSILTFYILLFSESAIKAASFGLVLWYTKMLPTLLPFAILSYIFVSTGLLNGITTALHKIIHPFLPISSAGIYPLIGGFLFGFPLGSKISSQMVTEGTLDYWEGNHLFSVCNNISPVFINGFILNTSLKRPDLCGITLLIIYLPPLLYYIIDSLFYQNKMRYSFTKKAASRSQINFKIIDAGIMSGFETLTKLGGYIMIFAIFAQMTTCIPLKNEIFRCLLIGFTEITNGITYISSGNLPFHTKYLLIVFCTAFGGLSGVVQTASMIKEAGFSIKKYIKTKVICSFASLVLAYFMIQFLF